MEKFFRCSFLLTAMVLASSAIASVTAEQLQTLADARANLKNYQVNIDFTNGVIPYTAGLVNEYEFITPDLNGRGIIIDHEKNADKGMKLNRQEFINGGNRFCAVELAVETLAPSKTHPSHMCFQIAFRPGVAGKKNVCLNAGFGCNLNTIKTPWGVFEPPAAGTLNMLMLVDTHTENAILYVNGKVFKSGKLPYLDSAPRILWGDYSSGVGGKIKLEYIRFAAWN